ncbi:hypothetical protein [Leptolyngbya sp. 7M]|uniref:hypothetical protein n=1 Tax=Leptolyngbya sp. 7M TaxID=2812896 RepID=UPI001B8BCB4E|nr:hypothetical protein [Leptolyngbya sp. 7M]QYO66417.1 hypothetical protein JVX88_06350 [Leptolyngbya sp. 7M]
MMLIRTLFIFALFVPVLFAQQTAPRPAESPRPAASGTPAPPLPNDDPPVVTKHSARIGGRQINYTVTTGYMPIRNAVSGETEARYFYMAYTVDGISDKRTRPLMFYPYKLLADN